MSLKLTANALRSSSVGISRKIEQGKVMRIPEGDVPKSGKALARRQIVCMEKRKEVAELKAILSYDDGIGIHAEFSLPDECGKRAWAAVRMFYPPYRRFHGIYF